MRKQSDRPPRVRKAVSVEGVVTLCILVLVFVGMGARMGGIALVKGMFQIAFDLLINTCFYIMAIAVIAGALAGIMTEFGVISILNVVLSPLMRPLYGLPGASAIGIFTTFFSDNPAILTLCDDRRFRGFFKKYQLPALTNLGTAFGMGLIVTVFMLSLQTEATGPLGPAVLIGIGGAVVGSVISTRLMLWRTRRAYGRDAEATAVTGEAADLNPLKQRQIREGSVPRRLIDALLEGGETGVKVGLAIVPGVLFICTFVILLTNAPDAKVPGVGLLPWIGDRLRFILVPLFGFTSSDCIAVPITALGSAGAAIGLMPGLVEAGKASAHDIAVLTSMCMCWSGYLSTHVAMMDALDARELTGAAITSHTVGGLCAGISANLLFQLLSRLGAI